MTHEATQLLLLDLAYGELGPEALAEVERHVAGCAGCTADLAAIAATRALTAHLAEVDGPARGRDELVAAARRAVAARRRRPPSSARQRAMGLAAAAAVMAIVAGVTVQLVNDRSRRDAQELTSPRLEPAEPRAAAVPAPGSSGAAPGEQGARATRSSEAPAERDPRATRPPPAAVAPPATARPHVASAPVAREPADVPRPGLPSRSRVEAGQRPSPRPEDRRPAASAASAPPGGVADEVERRRAAGELVEEERLLTCGGTALERIALVAPGARVVKLTVREGGQVVVEGWYDERGRLRAVRRPGGGATSDPVPEQSGRTPATAAQAEQDPPPGLPARAPSLAELATTCDW